MTEELIKTINQIAKMALRNSTEEGLKLALINIKELTQDASI